MKTQDKTSARRGRKPLNPVRIKAPCVNARVTLAQHAAYKRLGGAPALRAWLEENKNPRDSLREQMLRLQHQLRETRERLAGLGHSDSSPG